MRYSHEWRSVVLASGEARGYKFWVVSYGPHPCCYIEVPKGNPLFGEFDFCEEPLSSLGVHGGVSYSESYLKPIGVSSSEGRWFIGWDYGHAGDFSGLWLDPALPEARVLADYNAGCKKWETRELVGECIGACEKVEALAKAIEGEE